jgi:hypothetical protein
VKGVPEHSVSREQYLQRVLEAYRQTPGTTGQVRQSDRLLAVQLEQRGIPLCTVENALVLAAARRIFRPADAPPLATIRSLAYFVPVIEEILSANISEDYFQYLRHKLEPFYPHTSVDCSRSAMEDKQPRR